MLPTTERSADISVVVPVYNGERTIRRCIESVLVSALKAGNVEVICVDNASSDKTAEILSSFGDKIHIEQASVRGPSAARNAGLRKAQGTFIAFTDADCVVAPDWVERLIEPLRSQAACATGGRIRARPAAGPIERFGELVHDHQKAIEQDKPPAMIGMNMAARRDVLSRLGGFDERWRRTEDVEISYRMIQAGIALVYCPDAVVFHHNRDTLPTLFREAFLHGFYSPCLWKAYGPFIEAYQAAHSSQAHGAAKEQDLSELQLEPWQVASLWKLFRCGKAIGRRVGKALPPVQPG